MIKVENIEVWGFEHAIRGMRNPLNSWDKSDSCYRFIDNVDDDMLGRYSIAEDGNKYCVYCIGKNDLDLMKRLYKAGTEHRKYLRQIFVSMDITAPQFWWSEFDTYRIGVTENSTSKMHKLMAKEFTLDDFSFDTGLKFGNKHDLENIIEDLNSLREQYINYDKLVKDNDTPVITKEVIWRALLEVLPESYNQHRTVTMNYENVFSIIKQRTGHKLDEWNDFVKILKEFPYVSDLLS